MKHHNNTTIILTDDVNIMIYDNTNFKQNAKQ